MQRFPPDHPRKSERRTREASSETDEHREDDEPAATIDWLAHLAAGRIAVR